MKKYKNSQGFSLVISLIVLVLLLAVALSMGAVAIKNRKASVSETRSNIALQNSQSGVEAVLGEVKSLIATYGSADAVYANQIRPSGTTCTSVSGFTVRVLKSSDPEYIVEFFDFDGNSVGCDNSSKTTADLGSIKSIGTGPDGGQRAIEAGVNASI